jgi:simple sugar transport system permease protein
MFRMSKRESTSLGHAIRVYVVAILLALLVCAGVIYLLVRMNPIDVYKAIFDGALGSKRRIWITIRDTLILLCVAVGLAPAFKMRFWNIGAEGQILIGGVISAALMINLGDRIPNVVLLILMLVGSAIGGMIWGLIPTIFKAKWKTNETLFTLMMNYVAMQVVTYCIVFWENPKGSNTVGIINQQTRAGWLPAVFGNDYFWSIVIVGFFTILMMI